jgi:hypothetical protein
MAVATERPDVHQRVPVHPFVADVGHVIGIRVAEESFVPVQALAAVLADALVPLPTGFPQRRQIGTKETGYPALPRLAAALPPPLCAGT